MTSTARPRPELADQHPADCACCTPADPLDAALSPETQAISARIVTGFLAGLLLCALIDLATGRDGVLLMLGLR